VRAATLLALCVKLQDLDNNGARPSANAGICCNLKRLAPLGALSDLSWALGNLFEDMGLDRIYPIEGGMARYHSDEPRWAGAAGCERRILLQKMIDKLKERA
jgi:hypothetical protein